MQKYVAPIYWFVVLTALQVSDTVLTYWGGIGIEANPLVRWVWRRDQFWIVVLFKALAVLSLVLVAVLLERDRHRVPWWFRYAYYISLAGASGILCAVVIWNMLCATILFGGAQ